MRPLRADLAEAHAMILAERAARLAAEAEVAIAKQTKRLLDLETERLKLEIARLKRQRFGTSAERSARLEQLELALFELQESVAEVEATAELQISEHSPRSTATSRKPARRPLPEHLPRTRIVYPAPAACPCCGGAVTGWARRSRRSGGFGLSCDELAGQAHLQHILKDILEPFCLCQVPGRNGAVHSESFGSALYRSALYCRATS